MIRVNLLEGTAEQRVSIQKTKVAARRGQQIFMLVAALIIFFIVILIDNFWTRNAYANAKIDLDREQAEATKLEADVARKTELENELKQVEDRIKIIKQLRAEQKGPVAMLSAINERLPPGSPEFELQSITQKSTHLKILGTALNQQTVSDFANRLEFSHGMFTSLFFSVEGNDFKRSDGGPPQGPQGGAKKDESDAMAQMFHFSIDCDYNKPHDSSTDDQGQANKPASIPVK